MSCCAQAQSSSLWDLDLFFGGGTSAGAFAYPIFMPSAEKVDFRVQVFSMPAEHAYVVDNFRSCDQGSSIESRVLSILCVNQPPRYRSAGMNSWGTLCEVEGPTIKLSLRDRVSRFRS